MANDSQALTAEEVRVVEGVAREAARASCPACGRAIATGDEVAMSLGDVRRGAVGVTVHTPCFRAIGRAGLLDLMTAAYHQRDALRGEHDHGRATDHRTGLH
jgi:hypothetical protein